MLPHPIKLARCFVHLNLTVKFFMQFDLCFLFHFDYWHADFLMLTHAHKTGSLMVNAISSKPIEI